MKTILIRPNSSEQYQDAISDLRACEPPLWLCMMANCYADTIIIDAEAENLSTKEIRQRVEEERNNIEEVHILCTGTHPSSNIQQKAEAEKIKEELSSLNYKVEIYDYLPFDPVLMDLPKWNLIKPRLYRAHNWHCWGGLDRRNYGAIFTTISCPYSCLFCAVRSFYRSQYRKRSIELAIKDITFQYEKMEIKNFKMMDEMFVLPKSPMKEFCEALKNTIGSDINIWAYARINTVSSTSLKLMRKAGIRWLAYGIESGNEEIRRKINKGTFSNQKIRDVIQMTKDAGINVLGNYMFGFWEDTMETMKETLNLALELNAEYANFYCTVAYPGSPFYEEIKKQGVKLPTNYRQYSQMSCEFLPLSTETLSSEEVLKFRDEAFKLYHNSSQYLENMKNRFGLDTVNEIKKMVDVKIKRDIIQ